MFNKIDNIKNIKFKIIIYDIILIVAISLIMLCLSHLLWM